MLLIPFRRFILLILFLSFAQPLMAAPIPYHLNTEYSEVGFTYLFRGAKISGQMPVLSADMQIDLQNIPASRVSVTLNADAAQAGFVFATKAMKGPKVLDTMRHPEIAFTSTRITGDLNGAKVIGDLTVRGVTREVILEAGLFRQRGTEAGDLVRLTVLLTGSVNRTDFGAIGFPSYVGDTINLRIMAHVEK